MMARALVVSITLSCTALREERALELVTASGVSCLTCNLTGSFDSASPILSYRPDPTFSLSALFLRQFADSARNFSSLPNFEPICGHTSEFHWSSFQACRGLIQGIKLWEGNSFFRPTLHNFRTVQRAFTLLITSISFGQFY